MEERRQEGKGPEVKQQLACTEHWDLPQEPACLSLGEDGT